jgi:4-diphosphocytidyl-2-C-methyl-D-erythritol kinase
MPTAVRSHAKINLGLHIGAPRADGFHGLATVYQTLALYDVVTVTARRTTATALRLTSNDGRVPTDARNTAWKMAALALKELGIAAEVEIHIEKRLPVQGGLGAGSANAVAALVGLEVELGIRQSSEHGTQQSAELGTELGTEQSTEHGAERDSGWTARRLEIAAEVGSDVPLFLVGGTVLGRDRGQIVEPLEDIEPFGCVVAAPAEGVSTPQAFRDWDALCAREGLTAEASTDKLNELSRVYAGAFQRANPGAIPGAISRANPGTVGVVGTAGGVREGGQVGGSSGVLAAGGNLAGPLKSALVRTGSYSWTENDFERVVFPQHPSLSEIKHILAATGTPEAAVLAMLSGSGSALFGLYQTREDAEAARERLRPLGVRSYLTETLARGAYWREMILQQQD